MRPIKVDSQLFEHKGGFPFWKQADHGNEAASDTAASTAKLKSVRTAVKYTSLKMSHFIIKTGTGTRI